MSEIIASLRNEHRNLNKLLDLLACETDKLEQGEFADYQLIADIMQYFVNYPDVYHHPHEDLIFDILKQKGNNITGLIDEVYREHKKMAADGNEILDEIQQIQGNAIFSREDFVGRLRTYITEYHTHMDKEEDELFKAAEASLDDEDWRRIDLAIHTGEDPLFGRILDDEYRDLFKAILTQAEAE